MNQQKEVIRAVMVFDTWDSTSSVRARPYAYELSGQDFLRAEPSLWFPRALMPLMGCPGIESLPLQKIRKLHVSHLLYFLDYTTELEMTIVNKAVNCMVHGELSMHFSVGERSAVLKLYADEGYHALFSKDLAEQIAGYHRLERYRSVRLKHLSRLLARCSGKWEELALFVMAFISETVITRELSLLGQDDLNVPVLSMLRDHLHDEAKHSVFFADCFVKLWGQASTAERDFVVNALLVVVRIFCRPDISFIRSQAKDTALCRERVVNHLRQNWRRRVASTLQLTLKAVRRTDLLSNASYFRQLKNEGWIDE
ncbi:diiron oxygenase [Pseudomonas sp.]|uniref:diiron oxygenase n=1 Tax=Pseudomonas sp. TaxID=306 RepID=UPI0028AF96DB|nr:diiron oxygenase [Pseudomonas sp.]